MQRAHPFVTVHLCHGRDESLAHVPCTALGAMLVQLLLHLTMALGLLEGLLHERWLDKALCPPRLDCISDENTKIRGRNKHDIALVVSC